MKEKIIIDLGCGVRKQVGTIGVDISLEASPDVVCDLTKGLPFLDKSVEEIIAYHIVEHLPDFLTIMEEFHRVLHPGGGSYHSGSTFFMRSDNLDRSNTSARIYKFHVLSLYDTRSREKLLHFGQISGEGMQDTI